MTNSNLIALANTGLFVFFGVLAVIIASTIIEAWREGPNAIRDERQRLIALRARANSDAIAGRIR